MENIGIIYAFSSIPLPNMIQACNRFSPKYYYETPVRLQIHVQGLCPEATSKSAFTCLELTMETLEQGVKYVQS